MNLRLGSPSRSIPKTRTHSKRKITFCMNGVGHMRRVLLVRDSRNACAAAVKKCSIRQSIVTLSLEKVYTVSWNCDFSI